MTSALGALALSVKGGQEREITWGQSVQEVFVEEVVPEFLFLKNS